MPRDLKVFISSTSEDLQDYRAVARLVVLDMGWKPEMMEHFGAMAEPTVQACAEKLSACDLVVLLVAHRRGGVPSVDRGGNGVDSYTALELATARQKNIPVLGLMANETWPGNKWEDDADARRWVKTFREQLNLPALFFDYEVPTARETERLPAFRAKLYGALVAHRDKLRESARGGSPDAVDYTDNALSYLAKGNCLPLLGSGVFGDGPLSATALSSALHKEQAPSQGSEPPCLATAAEYFERLRGSREDLLAELERVLEEQSAQVSPSKVHELLAMTALQRPPVLVSTTPDLVLERALDAAGARYAVVTHVLRSRDCAHDGKILVVRKGKPPQLCLSDQLELGDEQLVIYKPLGSPLLHRQLDPDDEIDTVVITETDHLRFLSRLQNQHTQVPTKFHRAFQNKPLLFLGYPLDVWQYRLVVQVFDAVGTSQQVGASRKPRLAVREPASTLEELAWRRLGVDLIRSSLDAFARTAIDAAEADQRRSHAA